MLKGLLTRSGRKSHQPVKGMVKLDAKTVSIEEFNKLFWIGIYALQ